jgi:hypothetical protein
MKNFMLYILLFLFYANSSLLAQDSQPKFVKWGDCLPGKISREKFISLLDSTIQLNNASSSIQLGSKMDVYIIMKNHELRICVDQLNIPSVVRSCLVSYKYPLSSIEKIIFEFKIANLKNKTPFRYCIAYSIE